MAQREAGRDREERDRVRRQAGPHQPRRQGGEGRPPLRLRRARRRRRPEGPRRLRPRQGARGARGDPQGDRAAKRDMIRVPLREGRTLHHDVSGPPRRRQGLLRAAPAGTGIIAGGPMRAVFETLGMQDVVAKSMGSSNPYNMVRATFDALKRQIQPARRRRPRGIKVVRRCSRAAARRGRRPEEGAKERRQTWLPKSKGKTITSSRSAARSAARRAAQDAGRARPQQDAPPRTLEDTPRCAA
jgi:hypothetical protein